MRIRPVLLSVIITGVTITAANAQHRGSAEDQLACTPDVYRLCSGAIPDEDDIIACLEKRKSQLTGACKAVFSHPSASPAPAKPDEGDD